MDAPLTRYLRHASYREPEGVGEVVQAAIVRDHRDGTFDLVYYRGDQQVPAYRVRRGHPYQRGHFWEPTSPGADREVFEPGETTADVMG